MSAPQPPVAVLTLAQSNRAVAIAGHRQYRPATPGDLKVGLPLYQASHFPMRLGTTAVPIIRHLAAGTVVAVGSGFITFRPLAGRPMILSLPDACARFWVAERKKAEPAPSSGEVETSASSASPA